MKKTCSKCGTKKDVSGFHKQKGNKDGLRSSCKKCGNKMAKRWRLNNPVEHKKRLKQWHDNHLNYSNKYIKKRRKTDMVYYFYMNSAAAQTRHLKGYTRFGSVRELNGCSKEYLKDYLLKRFAKDYPGNKTKPRKCNIHHIIICKTFNFNKPEDQFKCFNFKNLKLMPMPKHRALHTELRRNEKKGIYIML